MFEDILVNVLNLSPEEREDVRQDFKEAIRDNRIKFLGDCGFITWLEVERYGKTNLYINGFYILSEGKFNIYELRKYFRARYKNLGLIYWERGDEFHYAKGEHK